MSDQETTVRIDYYSDILCIWAYLAQIKLDELRSNFGDRVQLDYRFVSVFGSVRSKIEDGWVKRGGLAGYAEHVREIVTRFDHVEVHGDVWARVAPPSSLGVHVLLKAAALLVDDDVVTPAGADSERPPLEQLAWDLRLAFFRDARDIAQLDVQFDVARSVGFPPDALRARIEDGRGLAALHEDHGEAARQSVTGSPTFLLNENRQRLYGNVGYRILEANVQELLRDNKDRASWC